MALNPIETAPKNEESIILVDDKLGIYEVAHWSAARSDWVREEGGPIRITPTHWMEPNASWISASNRLRAGPGRARRRVRRVLYAGVCATLAVIVVSYSGKFLGPLKTSLVEAVPLSQGWAIATASLRDGIATVENALRQRKQMTELEPPKRDVAAAGADIEIPLPTSVFVQHGTRDHAAASDPASARKEPDVRTAIDLIDPQNGLDYERQRGDALFRELALARHEIEARSAAASIADLTAQIAQAAATDQKNAYEKERQRSESLTRDLESAREEVEALQARVASAVAAHTEAEQSVHVARALAAAEKQAHEQERQRADALTRDLASAKRDLSSAQREVETLHVRVAAALAAHAPPAPEMVGLQDGRIGNQPAIDPNSDAGPKTSDGRGGDEPPVAALAGQTKDAAPPVPSPNPPARWLKRGEDFVAAGDFANARLVFRRAAKAGHARAALMLASTYDPIVLGRFQARGLVADKAKARFWYQKAKTLGSTEAPRRLELLAQTRKLSQRCQEVSVLHLAHLCAQ
jgi:hypothetical protein